MFFFPVDVPERRPQLHLLLPAERVYQGKTDGIFLRDGGLPAFTRQYIDREVTDNLEEKAFESLSPFEKQVVTLLMEGNDYIKIADQLGKTPKSIDNAIQRSRNKIKIIVD